MVVAIIIIKREYSRKVKAGYVFTEGDFTGSNKSLLTVQIIAFLGAFGAAFAGCSPAAIFGVLLMLLGFEPRMVIGTTTY